MTVNEKGASGPSTLADEPTIVLGLGRYGLALLEQLGQTWERARDASDDPRLANLRLVHVRGQDDDHDAWRAQDVDSRRLADEIGEGDEPVRALDFLFLRAMGLIRFFRGMYQVALARDLGVVQEDGDLVSEQSATARRLRTFEWRDLNPDIERAHELLRIEIARDPRLDLFVTPFLQRIRAGQSPRIIADALVRASHYAEGKDPSPWPLRVEEAEDGASLYADVQPGDWRRRVFDAGVRAPRRAIEDLLAQGVEGFDPARMPARLREPASMSNLELDDDALVHGVGVDEYQHLVGGEVNAIAQQALAARLITSGDLARHVESDHVVVGVGRLATVHFHEQETWRTLFRALQRDGVQQARELARARRALRRLSFNPATRAPEEEDEERGAAPEVEAVHAPDGQRRLLARLDLNLAVALDEITASQALLARYEALKARQETGLGLEHADVLTTMRATIELGRITTNLCLEAVDCLERHQREVDVGVRPEGESVRASSPGRQKVAHGRLATGVELFRDRAKAICQGAAAVAKELVARLGARPAGDPELLAARLQWAEVAAANGHEDDTEGQQLGKVADSSEENLDPASAKLAHSRKLIARHRLARFHEQRGELREAIDALKAVLAFTDDQLIPEHRSGALAHKIVASHSLGRLYLAQRIASDARKALESGLELARSALGRTPARATPGDVLAPEHRAIIERHVVLIEHERAALLVSEGSLPEAIMDLEVMLAERKQRLGWEHPDTLAAVVDLAAVLRLRAKRASEVEKKEGDEAHAARLLDAVRAGHAPGSCFDPAVGHESAFDPRDLLRIPWETVGWTTRQVRAEEGYAVVALPLWLHGFYDALDDDQARQDELEKGIEAKFKRFGGLCYRGLLELFWELRNHERAPAPDEQGLSDEERQDAEALAQSTDLIAEVLWRKAKDRPVNAGKPVPTSVEAMSLHEVAGARLRRLRAPGLDPTDMVLVQLDERLAALGALGPGALDAEGQIFSEVVLARKSERPAYEQSLRELRASLRQTVTSLLDTRYLSQTTHRSVGRPPRVQVYVVGDLGEPFARAVAWEVVALLHAELFRAFTAVFKEFRGGFARNLSIVPVLWFPNASFAVPRQASGPQDFIVAVRHEEAAMLDALLRLRRALFRLPSNERFVPVVYVCSRVNEGGVLSLEESVLQSHDFVSLCMRSALGADDWLRSIMMGPYGRDAFGTFGCIELELPVDRIREYLAGRIARMALGELLYGKPSDRALVGEPQDAGDERLLRPLVASSEGVVRTLTADCDRLADQASAPFADIPADPDPDDVEAAYSEEACAGVAKVILDGWKPIVAERGAMDRNMIELRQVAKTVGQTSVERIREQSDATVALIRHGSVLSIPISRLGRFVDEERKRLAARDREVDQAQRAALSQRLPDPFEAIRQSFSATRDAAASVPRRPPMQLAELLVVPFGFVVAGALAFAASVGLELHRDPGVLEWILTQLMPWIGAVAAVLLTRMLLERQRRVRIRALREAMRSAADAIRNVVVGPQGSIFSFLGARIGFMTALIRRRVASLAEEQARIDAALARRIRMAADAADRDLRRCAEDLGVRTTGSATYAKPPDDDLTDLLQAPGRARLALVDPADVLAYFDDTVGTPEAQRTLLPDVIAASAPVHAWRDGTWFSSRPALLSLGRDRFAPLLAEESCEHPRFAASIASRIDALSRQSAAQLGFPGYLTGSEGLDDDGVLIIAHSDLVLRPRLSGLLPRTRSDIKLRTAPVRTHAAYLLTLAQGIAPQLPLMHRRHMSRHENPFVPRSDDPIHVLTGLSEEIKTVFDRFGGKAR